MELLTKLRDMVERRHDYARKWKEETGKKVIGYLCTYVPEEVLYAAGALPIRILGSHQPEDFTVTEPHIYRLFCPQCRDCLAQGLKGKYDYLDGVVTAHGCIHIGHTFNSWRRHIPISYCYYLYLPLLAQSQGAKNVLRKELVKFKSSIEEWTGKAISEGALDRAIEIYNTNRRLMRKVYELRKKDNPPISGAEAIEIVMASQVMDKEEYNLLLEQLVEEIPQIGGKHNSGARVMLVGETDDVGLVRFIESLGFTVVIDDLCFGTRYFWNEVITFDDRLSAIASCYLDKPPCPLRDIQVERRRLPHILSLAQEYRAQSVILVRPAFCDPHGYDMPMIEEFLQRNSIPVLHLHTDATTPVEQLRTRIQAHLEMVS